MSMNEKAFSIKLVKSVEKFPVLYDYSLPSHSSKEDIDQAWREVSKEVDLSVASCKEKWRNCRNCWARYLRQVSSSRPHLKYRKVKPYYLADYLGFLTPFTKTKSQTENSDNASTEEQAAIEEESPPPSITEENSEEEVMKKPVSKADTVHRIREFTKTDSDRVSALSSPLLKKAKLAAGSELDSSDLYFFKSMLPDVAKLTPADKSRFKLFVMQKLNDMLYGNSEVSGR